MFQKIEQGASQAVKKIEDLDIAMVDLQMATGDSYDDIKKLVSGYNDFARQLGATTTEVTAGASDWLRQGKSIAETNKLIQDSMVLSKVSNLSSEDSTSYLTAMMKGYKKSVEEVSGINDSLTSIDLAAAVDAGGLAEATSRVAASADLAGVSLNRLLGYEAAVGEASQESMSVIGNSFKTIFSKMADIKTGKLEFIDEDGTTDTLSDVETVLNNVGVQLRSSTNEFRDFDDVLDDTAKRWDNLSSVQQAAVSKAFAGQRQANRFKLLMENYDTALKYEKIANESSGTAMQKFNDAYLNSIEAKQKSLQASFEGLSVNLISRDSINGILEATQALVEFLDKTSLLKGALTGLATGGLLKGFVALTASITQAAMKMQNFQEMLSMAKTGSIGADIEKLKLLTNGLSASQLKAIVSTKELSVTQRMAILEASGMSKAQAQATLSTMGLASAEAGATGSTISLSAAFKGLWNTLLANPIILISTALTVGMMAWSNYKQSIEDSIQKASDATSAWKESNNAISEQISKYKELKSQLDSGTLTPSEEYETRKQILEIQTQITSEYGNQVSGVDLVNGSLQTQLGILQQISAENAKKTLNENRKEYKDAEKKMTENRSYNLGLLGVDDSSELGKEIRGIIKSFEDEGLSLASNNNGTLMNIRFTGDATQAEESINGFMNKIEELKSEFTDKNSIKLLDSILNQSGNSLNENKKILEDYQENYKTFLQMDMMSQGTGKGTVAGTFNQYTEAVQKYNEALSSGDTDAINKARSDFASLSAEVDGLLSKDDNAKFATLFDDVTDQLSEASAKAYDFTEALSGNAGDRNQFNKMSKNIKEASDSLKGLKLDAVDVLDALVTEGMQAGENELLKLAEAWGLTAESSEEEIQSFIEVLNQAGVVSGEVADSAEIASKSFDSYSTSVQNARENLATLKDIMAESVSGAGISAENVSKFREIFGADADKALERTANGYHLNKKALAELQVQLDEMTKTDYLSALSDQYTELQNIEAKIASAEILGQDTSGLEASRNGILDNITSLQDLQYQYEATASAYQRWQSSMSGGEEGDMYDSIYGNLEKAEGLYDKGLTGTNAFREFADLMSNQDLSSASNEEIVAAYESAIPKIKRYFTEGQEGAQNFLTDIQNINSEWAHMNEDGSWNINFGMGQDQEVADALEIDVEAVQSIMRKLSDYGFEINLDEPIVSLEELRAQAESANETLSALGDDIQINLDTDSFEGVDSQISAIKDYISSIEEDSDLELDVKTDKLDAANSILEYLVTRKQEIGENEDVDITLNVNEEELQHGYAILSQLQSDLQNIQGNVTLDTAEVHRDINGCVAQIEAMTPEMKVALGIQGMSVEQIKAGLMDGSIEVPVSADTTQANSNIDSVKNNNIEDKEITVMANTLQATTALSAVKSYLSGITSKTVTVTVNKVTNESSNGTHGVQGTAHAHGTAFVGGSWGNPVGGKKLVGELGTEIIVNPHTGHWYTVGDNGAEFVDVPKNAIVFNHLQSENLLKNGHVTGRGHALASGTALSSGSGKFNVSGSGSKSNSSKTNKKSTSNTNKNTKAVAQNTKATEDNTKEQENLQDWIAHSVDVHKSENERLSKAIDSFEMHANQNAAIDKYVTDSKSYMNTLRNTQNAYMQKANALGLDGSYVHKIWAGDDLSIQDIQDEELKEKIDKYTEWYNKAKDLGDQMTELNQKIREAKISKLDNIQDDYDNLVSFAEGLVKYNEAVNELFEDRNLVGNQESLLSSMNQQLAIRQALVNEQKELNDQLNALVASGDIAEYTDTWLKWKTEINDVATSIVEADSALEELKQSIREIRYKGFEDSLETIDFDSDVYSSIRDLMSKEGIYDDDIRLTDSGKTQLGLMGQELVAAKQKVANYNTAIEALTKDYINGNITQAQFNKQIREYKKDQLDAVKATKEAREAILDLIKDGIEKETEAMEELISKRKEDLSKQKEYYDFQKKMSDQSKEMNKIRAQIAVLQGDDSLESIAKLRKLQSQLQELQDRYNEDQRDHEYDVVQDAYDDTLDKFKENQEETLHELETNLDAQNQAISNALEVTKASYDTIYNQLNTLATQYNITLTDSLTTPWSNAQAAIDAYQQAVGKLQGNISIDTSVIKPESPSTNQTTPTKNEAPNQNLNKSANGTWVKQDDRWWYQHDDGKWTENGWELIDGKWYKFDQAGWMQSGWQSWGTDSTGQTAWYHMGDPGDGSMKASQWINDNGTYYYVDHTGVMARNGYIKSASSGMYYWVNGNGVWEPQWDTYNPDLSKYKLYYANGKKSIPNKQVAYFDDTKDHKLDLGSEMIITRHGVLKQFDAGDSIFNKQQVQRLHEITKGYIPHNTPTSLSNVNNIKSETPKSEVNVHYDNVIGNIEYVDKNALPGLETIVKRSFDYTVKQLKKYDKR